MCLQAVYGCFCGVKCSHPGQRGGERRKNGAGRLFCDSYVHDIDPLQKDAADLCLAHDGVALFALLDVLVDDTDALLQVGVLRVRQVRLGQPKQHLERIASADDGIQHGILIFVNHLDKQRDLANRPGLFTEAHLEMGALVDFFRRGAEQLAFLLGGVQVDQETSFFTGGLHGLESLFHSQAQQGREFHGP